LFLCCPLQVLLAHQLLLQQLPRLLLLLRLPWAVLQLVLQTLVIAPATPQSEKATRDTRANVLEQGILTDVGIEDFAAGHER
jgi:hypothetical protein